MDVNEGTISAAMNCVASMAIEELAQTKRVSASEAAAEFLASKTAEMLFDDSTKLWWEGPSAIVDEYLREPPKNRP